MLGYGNYGTTNQNPPPNGMVYSRAGGGGAVQPPPNGMVYNRAPAQPQQGYGMNVQTSITPTGIYDPRQTRGAINQAVADSYAQNNAYEGRKRFGQNPGASAGLASARNMLPGMVNGRLGAANAMATIPFADEQANAGQMFQGQMGREAEALGWGGLGMQNQSNAASNFNRKQDMGWSLFNQLMGF